jgi:phosphoserine phosphatase RsbU/P
MSYLLILNGPNQGQRYPLDQPRTVIGRDRDCDVILTATDAAVRNPQAISRKHAVISQVEGKFFLEDGDGAGSPSRNHTYLNEVVLPFPQRLRLRNDDVIRICEFELILHDSSPDSDTSSIDMAIDHDSSFLIAQPARRLEVLLGITNRMSHTLELDKLLPDVVDTLLQLFKQADRAFLILVDEASGGLVSRSRKSRKPDEEGQAGFSTSIVERCLKTVKGLLSNDLGFGGEYDGDSVQGLRLRSVMCAPLWSQQGKAIGVLLLDSRNDRKKFTEDDLNLLMGVASQTSIALTNARFHRDALIRQSVAQESALAEKVVRSFLPATVPQIEGYEFFAHYQSAREVGGDYYDFIPIANGRLGIFVGDVAGKGVPAALVMTRFSAEARASLRTEADLAAVVRQLNVQMQPISAIDRFVTLAALLLDPQAHALTVVNAGHPSPLLSRRSVPLEEIAPRGHAGPALAVEPSFAYEAHQLTLQPGDTIVLFSDGVTDAMSAQGRSLGPKGLRAVLQRAHARPREMGERILQAVLDHAVGASQYDDITLVCFGRTA